MAIKSLMRLKELKEAYLEAVACVNFYWLEVLDILWFEEHVSGNTLLLMALEWISSEDDSLEDDLEWVGRHHRACSCHDVNTF